MESKLDSRPHRVPSGPRPSRTATRGQLRGLRRAVKLLLTELGIAVRHRLTLLSGTAGALRERPVRLNLGCGAKVKTGWVNCDLTPQADLRLDLRETLPLPDRCAELVYSEHFLEHLLNPGDSESFLAECYRVMLPGAVISIGVPDTEWPLREYEDGGEYYRLARDRWHPDWCETHLDHINFHFRQNGHHLYAYDAETLAADLRAAGFENPQVRPFDAELDSEDRRVGTLYMKARKPEKD